MLDYSVSGAVATITLNRPDVLNAIDDALGRALLDATERAALDDSVRCIVFTGAGKAFCSGEDLAALSVGYAHGGAPDLGRIVLERYNPLITAITAAPKPVVAALNGVAAGAGAGIALACDARIASERAKLVLSFSRVGLVPDSGALFFLARMVGVAKAWELAVGARVLGAEEALAMGLVSQVVPVDDFDDARRSYATQLARGPTRAYALTKALLVRAPECSLREQLEREAAAQRDAGHTRDHLEGVRAFLDKRPPAFEGR